MQQLIKHKARTWTAMALPFVAAAILCLAALGRLSPSFAAHGGGGGFHGGGGGFHGGGGRR
jgi:uncharacterized membrane protein YgcG